MVERVIAMLVAVLVVALAAVGCGGGDGSNGSVSEGTEAPVKGAAAICAESAEEIGAAVESYVKTNNLNGVTAEQGRQVAQDIVYRNLNSEIEVLGELSPSGGESQEISAIVDSLRSSVGDIKQNPDVVFAGKAMTSDGAAQTAKAYSLKSCGQG